MAPIDLAFFGSADFSRPILTRLLHSDGFNVRLVISRPAKPVGRQQVVTPNSLAAFAARSSLNLIQPSRLGPDLATLLEQNQVELVVVAAYGRIIPDSALAAVPHGFLNIHPSLLPKYRGATPVAQAILDGLTETGVTVMKMDAGLDTGPIVSQRACPIPRRACRTDLEIKLAELGADLLTECLGPYLSGQLQPRPQPEVGVSLTRPFLRTDGKINWRQSADQIDRQYRALDPWPGIYADWRGQSLKILAGQAFDLTGNRAPGTVWQNKNQPLLVQCGTGSFSITRLQLAGGSPLSAREFLRGHASLMGAQLG